jgi:hypothetical protein
MPTDHGFPFVRNHTTFTVDVAANGSVDVPLPIYVEGDLLLICSRCATNITTSESALQTASDWVRISNAVSRRDYVHLTWDLPSTLTVAPFTSAGPSGLTYLFICFAIGNWFGSNNHSELSNSLTPDGSLIADSIGGTIPLSAFIHTTNSTSTSTVPTGGGIRVTNSSVSCYSQWDYDGNLLKCLHITDRSANSSNNLSWDIDGVPTDFVLVDNIFRDDALGTRTFVRLASAETDSEGSTLPVATWDTTGDTLFSATTRRLAIRPLNDEYSTRSASFTATETTQDVFSGDERLIRNLDFSYPAPVYGSRLINGSATTNPRTLTHNGFIFSAGPDELILTFLRRGCLDGDCAELSTLSSNGEILATYGDSTHGFLYIIGQKITLANHGRSDKSLTYEYLSQSATVYTEPFCVYIANWAQNLSEDIEIAFGTDISALPSISPSWGDEPTMFITGFTCRSLGWSVTSMPRGYSIDTIDSASPHSVSPTTATTNYARTALVFKRDAKIVESPGGFTVDNPANVNTPYTFTIAIRRRYSDESGTAWKDRSVVYNAPYVGDTDRFGGYRINTDGTDHSGVVVPSNTATDQILRYAYGANFRVLWAITGSTSQDSYRVHSYLGSPNGESFTHINLLGSFSNFSSEVVDPTDNSLVAIGHFTTRAGFPAVTTPTIFRVSYPDAKIVAMEQLWAENLTHAGMAIHPDTSNIYICKGTSSVGGTVTVLPTVLAALDRNFTPIWQRDIDLDLTREGSQRFKVALDLRRDAIIVATEGNLGSPAAAVLAKFDLSGGKLWAVVISMALSNSFPLGIAVHYSSGRVFAIWSISTGDALRIYDANGDFIRSHGVFTGVHPRGVDVDQQDGSYYVGYNYSSGTSTVLVNKFDVNGNRLYSIYPRTGSSGARTVYPTVFNSPYSAPLISPPTNLQVLAASGTQGLVQWEWEPE